MMVGVAVTVMIVPGLGGTAFIDQAIWRTAFAVLHLNGCMANTVFFQQIRLYPAQKSVMIVRRNNLYMQRHQALLANLPYVDVMHAAHFGDGNGQVFTQ